MERSIALKVGALIVGTTLVVSCSNNKSPSENVKSTSNTDASKKQQNIPNYQSNEVAGVSSSLADKRNFAEMPDKDLQTLSQSGVARATQELASRSIMKAGNIDHAKELLIQAANQGSVDAAGQLALINRKNSDIALAYKNRFGKEYEANESEAYVWARVAELRGDRSARLGLIEIADDMSKAQIVQLEKLALQQYESINANYRRLNGKDLSDYPSKINVNDMDVSLSSIK